MQGSAPLERGSTHGMDCLLYLQLPCAPGPAGVVQRVRRNLFMSISKVASVFRLSSTKAKVCRRRRSREHRRRAFRNCSPFVHHYDARWYSQRYTLELRQSAFVGCVVDADIAPHPAAPAIDEGDRVGRIEMRA